MTALTREQFETRLFVFLKWIGVALFFLISFFPMLWMVVLSFRPLSEVLQRPAALPTIDQIMEARPYIGVWVEQNLGQFIGNSLKVSLTTVVITVTLGILGAYAATRLHFRGRGVFNIGILLIYMFPAMILAVPLFVVFTRLGLRNSLSGLVIVYLAQTLPVALYMLRSYFQTLPPELEEAALIDGCNSFQVFWYIIFPLARPAVVTIAVLEFLGAWTSFLEPLIYLNSLDNYTVALGLSLFRSGGFGVTIQWGPLMAATKIGRAHV